MEAFKRGEITQTELLARTIERALGELREQAKREGVKLKEVDLEINKILPNRLEPFLRGLQVKYTGGRIERHDITTDNLSQVLTHRAADHTELISYLFHARNQDQDQQVLAYFQTQALPGATFFYLLLKEKYKIEQTIALIKLGLKMGFSANEVKNVHQIYWNYPLEMVQLALAQGWVTSHRWSIPPSLFRRKREFNWSDNEALQIAGRFFSTMQERTLACLMAEFVHRDQWDEETNFHQYLDLIIQSSLPVAGYPGQEEQLESLLCGYPPTQQTYYREVLAPFFFQPVDE